MAMRDYAADKGRTLLLIELWKYKTLNIARLYKLSFDFRVVQELLRGFLPDR